MGTPLVFLHGVGGSGAIWQPQMAHFSKAYPVLAWDAPGYGGRDLLAEMSFAGLAAQLAHDMIAADMPSGTIVGHSFGGMVAQQLARDFPDRVKRLVLSGTSAAFGNPDGDFQTKFVASRTRPLDEGKSMADVARKIAPNLVGASAPAEAMELAIGCMSQVPEATYRIVVELLTTFDLRQALASIHVPALLIAGSQDNTAPAPMMQRMAARIPDAAFAIMDGAGHLAPLEQPEKFNALIETFLSKDP